MTKTGTVIPPQAGDLARATLLQMSKHGVEPNPQNYSVWYCYVDGSKPDMNAEIDVAIKEKRPITPDFCEYLYQRYIIEALDKKAIEDATSEAKLILEHIVNLIDRISGDTSQYSKDIDGYVDEVSSHVHSKALQEAFKAVIERTKKIKQNGEKLSERLESTSSEVRSLKRDLEKVALEAQKDFLTGCDNRKAFEQHLGEMSKAAKAEGQNLCVIMLDIDHFKKFNDKFGHQIGDEALKHVSRTLMDSVKGRDRVARYGGEEFAVILPDTPLAGGIAVAENLRKAVSSKSFRRRDTGEVLPVITISLGVSALRSGDSNASIIKRADDALYRSKNGGRNKVTQESS